MTDTPAEAVNPARKAYWDVMKTWSGRNCDLNAKLDAAWDTVVALITAQAVAAAAAESAAAERARIRQLAIDRGAGWQPTATCTCSRGTHEYTTGPVLPFADLLDAP